MLLVDVGSEPSWLDIAPESFAAGLAAVVASAYPEEVFAVVAWSSVEDVEVVEDAYALGVEVGGLEVPVGIEVVGLDVVDDPAVVGEVPDDVGVDLGAEEDLVDTEVVPDLDLAVLGQPTHEPYQ